MSDIIIPDDFAAFMLEFGGQEGEEWLAALPALVRDLCTRWELTLAEPFSLSYNYVAPVIRADGSPAVLKVGMPSDEFLAGIEFLRMCAGVGAVRLLEADTERYALLMERALPGAPLALLEDDDAATVIGAEVMRELWRPVPATHSFPTVERWLLAFGRVRAMYGGASGPLPEATLARAEALGRELLASAPSGRLMHGDLHHDNIVSAQREPWLIIDPKGLVGDPGYETGPFMHNPHGRFESWADPARHFARRADILAERLGYPRERIIAWGFVQGVLSAAWHVEDELGDRWQPAIARVETLATLL